MLSNAGSGGFGSVSGTATGGDEFRDDEDEDATTDPVITAAPAASGAAQVASAPASILGQQGLNHFDNRTADGGNNFSIEPPDQGLCVGNGYVLEAVNLVVGLRDAATNTRIPGTITGINTFFGLPFAINRTVIPPIRGPFTSDPKCLYDNDTKRFFVTILKEDVNPTDRRCARSDGRADRGQQDEQPAKWIPDLQPRHDQRWHEWDAIKSGLPLLA